MDRAVAFNKKRDELTKVDSTIPEHPADELERLIEEYVEQHMKGRPSKLKQSFSASNASSPSKYLYSNI
jgi:hypothetical protein